MQHKWIGMWEGDLLFAALHTLSTLTAHLCNPFTTLDPIDPASVLDFGCSVVKATRLHPEFILSADVTAWEELPGQHDCRIVHHWDCPSTLALALRSSPGQENQWSCRLLMMASQWKRCLHVNETYFSFRWSAVMAFLLCSVTGVSLKGQDLIFCFRKVRSHWQW